ncbi:conserved hypothetical protein [Pyrobaculum neutrophilum V24Sta]|uniref:Uncharacterized protein n=1 Tax=Pyrobaculum neutrophilum (strain DSM 2338 / JCM 9278 / NBRC 100436 / V24Sta) TaxID=444157 RepID=B1YA95_PYRNV|nr:conserved hypothetical protein [Pyrobaculum neutrophilum V24Sta]
MDSLGFLVVLVVVLVIAFVLGFWLLSNFLVAKEEFSRVYPIAAYVDAGGGFLLCVYNAGPHDFYGRWLVSTKSGKSVEVSLAVPVGRTVAVRGSLGESFTPGTSPALILVTGGGRGYVVNPIVVPDISSVSCG